jgi:hypothetical protein
MCFSKNISLFTFLMGLTTSTWCFSQNDPNLKIIGAFFAFVILMQGLEYLIWDHQICDNYNILLGKIAAIINNLQPIVFYALIRIFNKRANTKIMNILLGLYVLLIIPYTLSYLKTNACTIKNQSGHLHWKWTSNLYFQIIYGLFLLLFISCAMNLPSPFYATHATVFILLTYLISHVFYWKTGEIGTMWCFFAAFGPLFFILLK